MAAQTPLAFEPVHQLRDRMTQGEITPVDIVEGYLDRIARYDAKLHAYIDIYADEARAARRTPRRPPWRLAIASARSTASRWR